MQAFVDQYNSTVDFIHGEAEREKVVPNPTTDADRAKGVLHGDSGAGAACSPSLREAVADTFTRPARPTSNQLAAGRRLDRRDRRRRRRSTRTRSRAS